MAGADFLAALVASCLRGAFPPVDLRAVCLVRAIVNENVELSPRSTSELFICVFSCGETCETKMHAIGPI